MRPSPIGLPVLLLVAASAAGSARAEPLDLGREGARVERLRAELQSADHRVQLVEKQYAYRQPDEAEAAAARFADAELQYLLTNYQPASVLLYDLIGSQTFRGMKEYPDALYMLAESLFQQNNYLGARLYFREHMNLRGRHYRDALGRYLEISGRINEFSGIEQYVDQARGADGVLPADTSYVLGKWMFRRTDLPEPQRIARSREVFAAVAAAGAGYALQAHYFLGVLAVQAGELEAAAQSFSQVLALPARGDRERQVQESAQLALARVYFELGRYGEAIDRYQEIDYRSDAFIEALHEIAWAHVRRAGEAGRGEYEKALQACEKLLIAAPDSVLASEARTLQGHLLLLLRQYPEATEAYASIIDDYAGVFDGIDAKLATRSDPVAYLQRLFGESGAPFDISVLLPPVAVKWATTQREVADAVRVTEDLQSSRVAVAESIEISRKVLAALDQRQVESFPQFQEGLARVAAVDASLAGIDGELLQIEQRVVGADRLGQVHDELETIRAERRGLEERFKALPKSESELEARRQRVAEQVKQLEKAAFQIGLQVEGLSAVIDGIERYVEERRAERLPDPEGERDFAARLRAERAEVAQLRAEVVAAQQRLRDDPMLLGYASGGDARLRGRYEELVAAEKALLNQARAGLSPDALALVRQVDEIRAGAARLRVRSLAARGSLSDAARARAEIIREQVLAEAAMLGDYQREVERAAGDAGDLVGRIAFESFKRVRQQIHELVLKAEVGLVDVAWTRKLDKTDEIQSLAKQKERELKGLDEEFKEVLREVE